MSAADLAKKLVEKPAWWLPPPPEWGPFPAHMTSKFYAPDSIPVPMLPGSKAFNAVHQAWALQAAPLHVPGTAEAAGLAFLQAGGAPRRASDPMADLEGTRFRASRAREEKSHDGKGNYKRLPSPLEKPEWWIPTPASWGAEPEHTSGSFFGPAQVPGPVLPGAAGTPSLMPNDLMLRMWNSNYMTGTALLQTQAGREASKNNE